jgi:hypothetical protein
MNIQRNFEYEKGSRYPTLQPWYKNFSQKLIQKRFRGNNKLQPRTRIYLPSYELKNPKNKEKNL